MTKLARYLFGIDAALTISTRTIGGQSWYMAADICIILDIANHSTAVHRQRERDGLTLNETEWRNETIFTGTSRRQVLMVNDGGMLKLIFQGKNQLAKEAQERVQDTPQELIPPAWGAYIE